LLSCIKRVPFVFEVRDIWPQSAVELGALRHRLVIRALEAIELFLYRRAALIVPVAESTRPYLLSKGIAPENIQLIPNGIDARYLAQISATPESVRAELGLPDKFIVSYIGTHGMSHALDAVLRAAEMLSEDPKVHFLFVGEGAEKEHLKRLAASLRVKNVTFLAEQPRQQLLAFYHASNVSLVPLRRLPIFTKVLPSKLFELMGVGCPLICSVEGEAAALVQRAAAGLCIEPENAEALVAAIQRLRAEPEFARQLGVNGERFVKTYYLRSVLAEAYLDALATVVNGQWSVVGGQLPVATNHRPPTTDH
jgi:glycosyltransferase involved in cell wall biosynthesis